MKAHGDSRNSSTILNPGTGWRRMASPTHLPLYHWGQSPWYQLDRRLGGPQSQSGLYGENKNLLLLSELNLSYPAHSLVAIPTELCRLLFKHIPSSYILLKEVFLLINGAPVGLYSWSEFKYPTLKVLR